MTFAVPLFLLAALAAAIPVALHMINRQRAKELPFSTLRFLRVSVQKTRRRKRVHDVVLMILRMAVLLLISLGLARPTVTNLRSLLGGEAQSAVAIILDNSASMGVIDQGKTQPVARFETALSAARQIVREVRPGDEVALWVTCGPEFPGQGQFDIEHDKVKQILDQCAVSYGRADLSVKVEQARKLVSASKSANKEIYVLTDMQDISWEGLKKEPGQSGADEQQKLGSGFGTSGEPRASARGSRDPGADAPGSPDRADAPGSPALNQLPSEEDRKAREIPIVIVDCNRAPAPNMAIQAVELEATVPVAGLPIKAKVEVLNAASIASQRVVELYIDKAKEASSPVLNVPPGQRASHEFLFRFQTGGMHRGEVRLSGEDGCKLDDRRFFTMEVDQGIPVAIVVGQRHEIPYLDDAFYLEKALSPASTGGAAIRPQFLKLGDLLTEPLSTFTAIYCVNVPALDADIAERLRSYVGHGGNLVWICGENVVPEEYNRMNDEAQKALLPAPLLDVRAAGPTVGRDAWHVSFLDKTHHALRHLAEPASLYESILVEKHVRMDTKAAGNAKVLLGLDDGEGLLVQRRVQRGTVILLGTTAHKTWTNLPLRPIFVPMFTLMTFEMAGIEQARHTLLAGSPLVLRFDEQSRPSAVEVLSPSGARIQKENRDKAGDLLQVFQYPRDRQDEGTHAVGVYLLNVLGGPRPKTVPFSVNMDPEESVPTKLDRAKLQEYLGRTPLVFAEDPDDLSSTFQWLREGKSLWEWFLSGVLVFLVFETFLSNRLSPKQEEDSPERVPPGMRRLAKKGHAAA